MKVPVTAMRFICAIIAVLTLSTLVSCNRKPEPSTVHKLVEDEVKSSLDPYLGPVKVVVEKYALGDSFSKADRFSKQRTYFPCKAIYSTVDSRGNTNKDCVWIGDLTTDEWEKWIAIPYRIPIAR